MSKALQVGLVASFALMVFHTISCFPSIDGVTFRCDKGSDCAVLGMVCDMDQHICVQVKPGTDDGVMDSGKSDPGFNPWVFDIVSDGTSVDSGKSDSGSTNDAEDSGPKDIFWVDSAYTDLVSVDSGKLDDTSFDGGKDSDLWGPDIERDPGPGKDMACVPDCYGKECGDDGCGGSCGNCPVNEKCVLGTCVNSDDCIDDPVGSCKAIYECLGECPGGTAGEACIQECQARLTPEGRQDYQNFTNCLQQYCSSATTNDEFYACLEDYCIELYYGCFWGCNNRNCSELIAAINSCPDDNPATFDTDEFRACVGDSWGNSTTDAQLDLQHAIDCSEDNCPTCLIENPTAAEEDECNQCYGDSQYSTCKAEWGKCRASGDDGCSTVLTCMNDCTDQTCMLACYQGGTVAAQDLYYAVEECILSNCDQEDPTAQSDCISAAQQEGGACYDELSACISDV